MLLKSDEMLLKSDKMLLKSDEMLLKSDEMLLMSDEMLLNQFKAVTYALNIILCYLNYPHFILKEEYY